MTFTSVEFVFFLPVVFLAYWWLPRRATWQNLFLLVTGYVFYATWHPKMVLLLAATTLVDFGIGHYLSRHPRAAEGGDPRVNRNRRRALAASVVWNVGLL